ncbi:ABC transporter ATP-binding protein [Neobacillus drentensis]|uniref:ABC transporter ATP-binding protein n=1 Tax=Neobacillus drentensis TaxID=220684 RepID=UPI002858EEEB|nr:ABC transporter ATP-binding protein [Neobacillus drentensis]MDR7239177.1 ABC-type nitrate/sulfonate/bicarbonate transport system ATPase subunit [Neobacillus drentensis]
MSYLRFQNVSKHFRQNEVLKDLDFSIHKNEFVSIIGPSGSGKSTIFNLIGGILSPDEGEILLDGQCINGKRGFISYMPQTSSLFPWRTILENVLLGQELQGKKDVKAAREMLEIAGLSDYENAYPHMLSGGMKQRAAFIRALLSPQEVICLDEPFSALDELTRFEMQKWLVDMWESHRRTILFITHNIEEALYLSDRVMMLSAKKAKVVSTIEVPFERPRHESILLDERFIQCKRDVYYQLVGEVK